MPYFPNRDINKPATTPYQRAYRDHTILWQIGAAEDMTGGYVESGDLDALLDNPSAETATHCLTQQIEYWFHKGTEDGGLDEVKQALKSNKKVRRICRAYHCDDHGILTK